MTVRFWNSSVVATLLRADERRELDEEERILFIKLRLQLAYPFMKQSDSPFDSCLRCGTALGQVAIQRLPCLGIAVLLQQRLGPLPVRRRVVRLERQRRGEVRQRPSQLSRLVLQDSDDLAGAQRRPLYARVGPRLLTDMAVRIETLESYTAIQQARVTSAVASCCSRSCTRTAPTCVR